MNEDFGFSLHRRGTHRLAGRTILQLAPSLDEAADHAAIEVAWALAEAGARPLVAAPAGRLVGALQARGGVWVDFPTASQNPLAMAIHSRKLKALIAREQVDLVHARSRLSAWVAYAAIRGAGTPFVTSLHQINPGQSIVKQQYNSVMAKGDMTIAGSRFAAATIASLYPAESGRITLVRPGVALEPFNAALIDAGRVQSVRAAWQVAPDERVILLVGRQSVWKGHKVAIEALRLLLDRGLDDLRLVFIGHGQGTAVREIDVAAKKSGLAERIRKIDACGDMPAALLAAAVLVVPSIEPEAFGRVAVEAQAVGTPVVVSDLGAIPETVLAPPETEPAQRTGWRVSPSDPALLCEAVGDALALGASSRDALALRARRHVETTFAIERMARETLDAYAALLERRAATV